MVPTVANGAGYGMPSAARHAQDTVWPLHASGATDFRAADCEIPVSGFTLRRSLRLASAFIDRETAWTRERVPTAGVGSASSDMTGA